MSSPQASGVEELERSALVSRLLYAANSKDVTKNELRHHDDINHLVCCLTAASTQPYFACALKTAITQSYPRKQRCLLDSVLQAFLAAHPSQAANIIPPFLSAVFGDGPPALAGSAHSTSAQCTRPAQQTSQRKQAVSTQPYKAAVQPGRLQHAGGASTTWSAHVSSSSSSSRPSTPFSRDVVSLFKPSGALGVYWPQQGDSPKHLT